MHGSQHGNGPGDRLTGQPELRGADVAVPGDPSSAAFPLVAGLLVPGSRLTIRNVGSNPLRTGLFDKLREMGADLTIRNARTQGGELLGDVIVGAHRAERRGRAARARAEHDRRISHPRRRLRHGRGTSRLRGLAELRVKESDRLAATAAMLRAGGVRVEIEGDDLIVHGAARIPGGGLVQTHMDHRLAMSALVFGETRKRKCASTTPLSSIPPSPVS